MSRRVKELISNDLSSRFRGLEEAVIIDYAGLSAEQSREFRAYLRGSGVSMNVVKNTLALRVFADLGIEFEANTFIGPAAVVWGGEDAIMASKAVADWSKKAGKVLAFKAGMMEGKPLDQAAAAGLAQLPGKKEARGMTVTAIAGPLTSTVAVMQNILSALPRLMQAIADKNQGEGD